MRLAPSLLVTFAVFGIVTAASAQQADPATMLASQTEAMKAFAMLDGAWRGPATVIQGDGKSVSFIQTERIGPFLGGSVKVIEGRGYNDDGAVRFNAFGIVSYNSATRAYTLHSHAQGYVGDFNFVPTGDGYRWEIPIGPATLRYVATIKDDELHEIGERVGAGGTAVRVFEMRLKRIGSTDWPAAGAIGPK